MKKQVTRLVFRLDTSINLGRGAKYVMVSHAVADEHKGLLCVLKHDINRLRSPGSFLLQSSSNAIFVGV